MIILEKGRRDVISIISQKENLIKKYYDTYKESLKNNYKNKGFSVMLPKKYNTNFKGLKSTIEKINLYHKKTWEKLELNIITFTINEYYYIITYFKNRYNNDAQNTIDNIEIKR